MCGAIGTIKKRALMNSRLFGRWWFAFKMNISQAEVVRAA